MKKLLKKLVKLLYVAVLPLLGIAVSIMYFTQYGWGYTPVSIAIVLITALCILNAIFFNTFMDKVILMPKFKITFEAVLGLGLAWQKGSLMIILPFIIIEITGGV